MSSTASPQTETARLRRVPRYGVFLVLGAVLGVIGALIATAVFYDPETTSVTGVRYSFTQIFGFLSLFGIPLGIVVGGVVALLLDRAMRRRARTVHIDRETVVTPADQPDAAPAEDLTDDAERSGDLGDDRRQRGVEGGHISTE